MSEPTTMESVFRNWMQSHAPVPVSVEVLLQRAFTAGWLSQQLSGDDSAALSRQLAERQWQPIETAPRDGSRIILYDGDAKTSCHGKYGLISHEWRDDHGFKVYATHWMPLPPGPEGEGA